MKYLLNFIIFIYFNFCKDIKWSIKNLLNFLYWNGVANVFFVVNPYTQLENNMLDINYFNTQLENIETFGVLRDCG